MDQDYEIISVEPAEPPVGMDGNGWHCYIIEQGQNTIRGYQQGDIEDVKQTVEAIVARLNERRCGRSGRVHLTMSIKKKSKSR